MRQIARFLVPILLVLCAAASEGASPPRIVSRLPTEVRPTPLMPIRWTLPGDWFASPLREDGDHHVQYFSGPEATLWARAYSWPVERSREDEGDALRRVRRLLMPGLASAGSRTVRGVVHFTMLGWGGSQEASQNRGTPDTVLLGRASRQDDRLIAVVVAAKPRGTHVTQMELEEMLMDLRFESGMGRSVAFSYGAVVPGLRPPGQSAAGRAGSKRSR